MFLIPALAVGGYLFHRYWIHRYDELIARQAKVYNLDERLVWSVIYQETYFRNWVVGDAGEIGLMQVTPVVAREWAREAGMRELEQQVASDVGSVLRDPERNIQIGCWYLEKMLSRYRHESASLTKALAAYNAGASRVDEWSKDEKGSVITNDEQFIGRIKISSTQHYVASIYRRYIELAY